MQIKNITDPIRDYLDLFDKRFSESLELEGFFIDDIIKYILEKRGKKIRPILTFLAAKISGGITSQTIRCALILELLHTASLIHDDVIDESDKRRGKKTLNRIWGNNTAVLFGDYLYGKCLELIETQSDFNLLPKFAKIGSELPLGELLQKQVAEGIDYSEETYYKVIGKKTATMMEASAELGAISSGATKDVVNLLKNFGFYMGLAFQVRDDILDFSPEFNTGKPYGNDIKEKKKTLPLIYLLDDSNKEERDEILKFVNRDDKSEKEILELIEKVNKGGYLEKANDKVQSFCKLAEIQLNDFKDSESKTGLIDLLYSLANRKK